MSRGRTKLVLNKGEFQDQITRLEENNVFSNLGELWSAIEQTEWAKSQQPRPLTAIVAYQRAKDLGISINTKPGKRGRQSGEKLSKEQKAAMQNGRTPKSEKMGEFSETFSILLKDFPSKSSRIERAKAGSLRAAIDMKCIDCSCEDREEIRKCTVIGCPLYPHRPYQ